jgi:hypothetical protein
MTRVGVSRRRYLIGLGIFLSTVFGVAYIEKLAWDNFRHAQACKDAGLMWDEQIERCKPLPASNSNR